jgi:hypothetical protein
MRPPTVNFARILVRLGPVVVVSCSTAKTRTPGEVVVVITSDMAVPQDIDTLAWSVTVAGDEGPFKAGSVDLKANPLPQTLAIVSDHAATGTVRLDLDASRAGTRRVHREALVPLPADSEVKRLAMPLDWLCTIDANPSLSCGAGETCVAGACVSSAAEPVPYTPPDAGACFDVGACFLQPVGGLLAVAPDPKTGVCVPQNIPIGGNDDVNVALAVNTSQIGNYGACGVNGVCLIPLARGGPEGWTTLTEDDGTTRIALPQAVCDDSGTTLNGVVVSRATPSCPAKRPETPICGRPDTCVTTDVCPSDWGPSWVGSSCSGSASVSQGAQACWPPPPPPADAEAGSNSGDPTGLWCCAFGTGGEAGSLLIDDMSAGPQVKIAPPRGDEIAGFWFTATDDQKAPLMPVPTFLFTYTAVPPAMTPDGGPMNAACLKSDSPFTGDYALEGFNFVLPQGKLTSAGDTFDVSPYTGIRFWAWSRWAGQAIKVDFPDPDTGAADPTAGCKKYADAGGCGNDWAIQNLILDSVWAPYTIRWDQLSQADWGPKVAQFDPKHVFATVFIVAGSGPNDPYPPFDFCVSQIYFTQ